MLRDCSNALRRLLEICVPISEMSTSENQLHEVRLLGKIGEEIADLLLKTNGFYALESALHFFPAFSEPGELSVFDWNAKGLWRNAYEGRAAGLWFFAEDAFGGQFCVRGDTINTFDPETGETSQCCDSLADPGTRPGTYTFSVSASTGTGPSQITLKTPVTVSVN